MSHRAWVLLTVVVLLTLIYLVPGVIQPERREDTKHPVKIQSDHGVKLQTAKKTSRNTTVAGQPGINHVPRRLPIDPDTLTTDELRVARGRTSLFNHLGKLNDSLQPILGVNSEQYAKINGHFNDYISEVRKMEMEAMKMINDGDNQEIVVPRIELGEAKEMLFSNLASSQISEKTINILMSALDHASMYTQDIYPLTLSYVESEGGFRLAVSQNKRSGMLPTDKNYSGIDYRIIKVTTEFGIDAPDGRGKYSHIIDNIPRIMAK